MERREGRGVSRMRVWIDRGPGGFGAGLASAALGD